MAKLFAQCSYSLGASATQLRLNAMLRVMSQPRWPMEGDNEPLGIANVCETPTQTVSTDLANQRPVAELFTDQISKMFRLESDQSKLVF